MVEVYIKLKLVLIKYNNVQKRTITYMTYMFWKLITVLLKLIFLGDFSNLKIFLTKLSCYYDNYFMYGDIIVLSARAGFMHACIFWLPSNKINKTIYNHKIN
jgi:hypothetical protein